MAKIPFPQSETPAATGVSTVADDSLLSKMLGPLPRAHLIMNPEARKVTPSLQHLMTTALEARFELAVTETHGRDAGVQVAQAAVAAGAELIIAFGGDGLVNEVVNGMAGSDAVLAIIPGGTMNVFARNLGIPSQAAEAADYILNRAGRVEPRSMTVGTANGRYFTFATGCGFDAEAAGRVEAHRATKQRFGEPYFYAAALATFATSYATRRPFLTCEGSFGVEQAVLAVGLIGATYAYLAGRPLHLGDIADTGMTGRWSGGMDKTDERQPIERQPIERQTVERQAAHPGIEDDAVPDGPPGGGVMRMFLLRRLGYFHLHRYALGALTGHFGPHALCRAGIEEFTVTADVPIHYHVDGETLPPAEKIRIRRSPWPLKVLA